MPVLKLYQNGLTAGCPPRKPNRSPSVRDECKGWSLSSSRSNTRFLYSVLSDSLLVSSDGDPLVGVACSLTIRHLPQSHDDWKRTREALFFRLRRKGLYRLHWLTEWQKRGIPHLHIAAWFRVSELEKLPRPFDIELNNNQLAGLISCYLKVDWLELSVSWRSSLKAQHVEPIFDELGWLRYLAKHASRGAGHYQRAINKIPSGWLKTGRMWGHLGDFPTKEPLGIDFSDSAWFPFRRICRAWRIAQARCSSEPRGRRIRSARRMLQCKDPSLSRVRGVSEWISFELGLLITNFLDISGYKVVYRG